jgi:CRP-like cAMP-binding protein
MRPSPQEKLWYLAKVNLFQELPEDILEEIAATSHMRNFEKGRYISTPHSETERIYFLKEGEVEIYESTDDGRKIIIDILKPGDIFGYETIVGDQITERRQFVRANKDVIVCTMLGGDFLALLEKKPGVALRLIKDLSMRLSNTEGRLRDTALESADKRLMEELERLYKRYGEESEGQRRLVRKFTHEELANLIGTTRETVTRSMSRLSKNGLIIVNEEGAIVFGDSNH